MIAAWQKASFQIDPRQEDEDKKLHASAPCCQLCVNDNMTIKTRVGLAFIIKSEAGCSYIRKL